MTLLFPTLGDARIDAVLARLYADALRTDAGLREAAHRRGIDEGHPAFYRAMREAFMPVTPEFGKLLHALARQSRARCVVEVGTSFGVSTVFLAAALRANGGGCVVSCELDAGKAERAQAHLGEAGLSSWVELRVGDALETLREALPAPADLVLLDGAKSDYLALLRLLEGRLAGGCVVASDNSEMAGAADYLAHVRDPAHGYVCASLSTMAIGRRFDHDLVLKI